MKNRQFIVLCLLVVIGFCVLWFKIDKVDNKSDVLERVIRNVDQNVANMDVYYRDKLQDMEYMVEDISDTVNDIYYSI